MGLFLGFFKFPGSRGFIPGKREAKIRKFPEKSLPRNSREETLADGSHMTSVCTNLAFIQYWSEVWNLTCSQKVGYSVLVRSLKPNMCPKGRVFSTGQKFET